LLLESIFPLNGVNSLQPSGEKLGILMFKQKVQEHKLFELNLLQFSLVHQLFKEGKGCKDQPQNLYTQNYKEGI